jgi:hypothetical protein
LFGACRNGYTGRRKLMTLQMARDAYEVLSKPMMREESEQHPLNKNAEFAMDLIVMSL